MQESLQLGNSPQKAHPAQALVQPPACCTPVANIALAPHLSPPAFLVTRPRSSHNRHPLLLPCIRTSPVLRFCHLPFSTPMGIVVLTFSTVTAFLLLLLPPCNGRCKKLLQLLPLRALLNDLPPVRKHQAEVPHLLLPPIKLPPPLLHRRLGRLDQLARIADITKSVFQRPKMAHVFASWFLDVALLTRNSSKKRRSRTLAMQHTQTAYE